jgi:hypothetical protein
MSWTFSEVTPSSSAATVAITAQLTASAQSSSPSRTTGPSGSLDMVSSRMTRASGPPWPSGQLERIPASCDLSEVQAPHRPWMKAS